MKSRFLKTTVAFAALLGISASAAYAASCTNEGWKKVMSRGKIVVA